MTDFLESFGAQLAAAEDRLFRTKGKRRRGRLLIGGTVLAVLAAVPALAATQPWSSMFGRPELRDSPASVSVSEPPRVQAAVLSVLRRPQTAQDRGPLARRLLRSVGREFTGVRPG